MDIGNQKTFISYLAVIHLFGSVISTSTFLSTTTPTTTPPSKCDDICWNGDNCALLQCQQCPFSCSLIQNTTQNEPILVTYDDDDDDDDDDGEDDNKYNPSLPAAALPEQCKTIFSKTCSHKCIDEKECTKDFCSQCKFCENNASTISTNTTAWSSSQSSCSLQISFQDYTNSTLFTKTRHYFNRFRHSGKPYFHEAPPTFFHLNSDSTLDYFNSMHGHPLFNERELSRRLEIALSVPINDTDRDRGTVYSLRQIADHIIIEDDFDELLKLDLHGCIIVDLDSDGYLDIYITNGGNMGLINEKDHPETYDNIILWGEPSKTMIDSETGEPITLFRGGRKAALDANINMRKGRGRFVSLLDVNHDGLLDLFVAQDRRLSNDLVPGYLLINQGNRKWKKDASMQEYSRTLMVTDADGDGFANEIVLNRSFCYPQRNGPDVDPMFEDLGEFPSNVKQFCSTRPVGTTVIFQYNNQTKSMDEISKPFVNFGAEKYAQPTCCPHTSYDGSNDCNAISLESGDFDDDSLADHIFLYKYKMEFYFSSDQPEEGYSVLGNPNYVGFKVEFPSYCGSAISLRVTDLDNDGHDEIFVICENAGIFLIYTRAKSGSVSLSPSQYKTSWTLENGCNNNDSLGAINDRFLASPTRQDLDKLCNMPLIEDWASARKICNDYHRNGGQIRAAKTSGVSIVDIDNDGFSDVVVAHSFGYLRFFYNTPSSVSSSNRYISFDLSNAESNGIGVTLILYSTEEKIKSEDKEPKVVKQFRSITSYLHGTDRHSSKDAKITFGLGETLQPFKLEVRWPGKQIVEVMDLTQWEFFPSPDTKEKWIEIRNPTTRPSFSPSADPSFSATLSSKPSYLTKIPSPYINPNASNIINLTGSTAPKCPVHQLIINMTVVLVLVQMIVF